MIFAMSAPMSGRSSIIDRIAWNMADFCAAVNALITERARSGASIEDSAPTSASDSGLRSSGVGPVTR